jgi:hypothetical protein
MDAQNCAFFLRLIAQMQTGAREIPYVFNLFSMRLQSLREGGGSILLIPSRFSGFRR